MDSSTRCGECHRTLAGGQYSLGGSRADRMDLSGFHHDAPRSFGQVITTIEKGNNKEGGIPLEGIMKTSVVTRTEYPRETESMGGASSEVDFGDKRDGSTDNIRENRNPPV